MIEENNTFQLFLKTRSSVPRKKYRVPFDTLFQFVEIRIRTKIDIFLRKDDAVFAVIMIFWKKGSRTVRKW